jgi:hypothetical protein
MVPTRVASTALLVLALVLVLGLSLASTLGAAITGKGDPQKKLNAADQARARAMVLRQSDLGPSFKGTRHSSSGSTQFDCAALDESDLTITGLADSPDFSAGLAFALSEAQLYESRADASTAWKRDTSPAGIACLRSALRREYAKQGLALLSLRKLAFPNVSQKTAAYRLALRGQSQGLTVSVYLDVMVLLHARAEVMLGIGSGLAPPGRASELRLARVIAARMTKAMRGA